jgi:hypothetical protein
MKGEARRRFGTGVRSVATRRFAALKLEIKTHSG